MHYRGELLHAVTDNHGRRVTIDYYSNGNVRRMTSSEGKTSSYSYDATGNLETARLSSGNVYRYEYDVRRNLTKITYPDGTTASITYDMDRDWAMSYRDAKGCLSRYTYQFAKNPRQYYWSSVEKQCGATRELTRLEFFFRATKNEAFMERQRIIRENEVVETEYNMAGQVTATTRNGIRCEYRNDAQGKSTLVPVARNVTKANAKVVKLPPNVDASKGTAKTTLDAGREAND